MTTNFAEAYAVGKTIDLSDCVYGPPHWPGATFANRPSSHYPFLAGLARSADARRVVEIGTHFGGSCTAMIRGMKVNAFVATVDIEDHNPHWRPTGTLRYIGDALAKRIYSDIAGLVSGPIDLLFVDAGHDYGQTWETIAIYANRLRPRFIVVDDIHLNRSMEKLWTALQARPGSNATDVSDLIHRPTGFGVLEPDYSVFTMSEMPAWKLAIARRYWRFGHKAVDLLPTKVKKPVRILLRGGKPLARVSDLV